MLNQSAESFLINSQNKDIIYKNIFIENPHGRLNHWIFVFRTLFILFRKIGVKAHLYSISENLLSREFCAIMNDSLTKKRALNPNYPLFRSKQEDFFSLKLKPLKESIEKNEFEEFKKEFIICFQPIIKLLTKKETINKLSKKLKIDESTFLERKKISIHLRRGDLAVLEKKKYLDSPIGSFFKSDYFICTNGFYSHSEFLYAKDNKNESRVHPALRLYKQKPIGYYKKIIQEKIREGYLIFLFSDGYTRIANEFKKNTKCNYRSKEIEEFINKIEFPFEKDPNLIVSYGENIIGCSGGNYLLNLILSFREKIRGGNPLLSFNDLICIAYNADLVIAKESEFPLRFIENIKY